MNRERLGPGGLMLTGTPGQINAVDLFLATRFNLGLGNMDQLNIAVLAPLQKEIDRDEALALMPQTDAATRKQLETNIRQVREVMAYHRRKADEPTVSVTLDNGAQVPITLRA